MILATSFFFYFFCLAMFSLVSHPVYYCVLLVLNSLICSFICYSVYGFSWYSLLFCLVYIGGVYILFVFVSVHSPNSSVVSYWNFSYLSSYLIVFLCISMGCLVFYSVTNSEFSAFLCTLSEGCFYLCMCLTLLFGFFILSLIMSIKVNHYR
uniref:NADH dehydrogenase subunit 6 n=1 Tax=Rhinebothrium scobinae TaxID=3079055 RepID=A0A8K1SXD8_9CEST|nr:NADH dehydrogenase subunit 6 [Rhinebothrium scobinae]UFQ88747.1 NADH dehydrogenase subunit 6 [Rhinebothrium scobinae]